MLGTYNTYRGQLEVLGSGHRAGTYGTYWGQLEVLRSVIGLHVGNLQHL